MRIYIARAAKHRTAAPKTTTIVTNGFIIYSFLAILNFKFNTILRFYGTLSGKMSLTNQRITIKIATFL